MRPVRKFFITLLIYFGSVFLAVAVSLFVNSYFPWLDKYEIVLGLELTIIWSIFVSIFMILVKMD